MLNVYNKPVIKVRVRQKKRHKTLQYKFVTVNIVAYISSAGILLRNAEKPGRRVVKPRKKNCFLFLQPFRIEFLSGERVGERENVTFDLLCWISPSSEDWNILRVDGNFFNL